jgi:hypothetical protein
VHAGGESVRQPVASGTHAVVLSVPDEASLLVVAECLSLYQIDHVLIREPDEPYRNAAMAIGLAPVSDRRKVRRVLGRLSLLE